LVPMAVSPPALSSSSGTDAVPVFLGASTRSTCSNVWMLRNLIKLSSFSSSTWHAVGQCSMDGRIGRRHFRLPPPAFQHPYSHRTNCPNTPTTLSNLPSFPGLMAINRVRRTRSHYRRPPSFTTLPAAFRFRLHTIEPSFAVSQTKSHPLGALAYTDTPNRQP
jgi:hypothetical protein